MKGDGEKMSLFVDPEQVLPVALPCHSISMEVSGYPWEGGKGTVSLTSVGLLVLQSLFLKIFIHIN